MWKVRFEEIEVFTSKTDVEALQFALSLHQASNVPHKIYVTKPHPEEDALKKEFEQLPGDKCTAVDFVVCTLERS